MRRGIGEDCRDDVSSCLLIICFTKLCISCTLSLINNSMITFPHYYPCIPSNFDSELMNSECPQPHPSSNTSRSMRYNRPSTEPIIRVTNLPTIRNRSQKGTLATRTVRRTEHTQIMPIILTGTLPRYTLHVRGIVVRLQCFASRVVSAIAMVNACVEVRVVWVASRDGGVEEAQVPLYTADDMQLDIYYFGA